MYSVIKVYSRVCRAEDNCCWYCLDALATVLLLLTLLLPFNRVFGDDDNEDEFIISLSVNSFVEKSWS